MKKYLALALIAALAAFAAPSFADMTGDNGNYTVESNYTWTESDNSKTINSLTINSGATLTMVSNAVVNGINATISGVGAGSTIKGANVNDFYGISSIRDLDIIADKAPLIYTSVPLSKCGKCRRGFAHNERRNLFKHFECITIC